MLHLAGALRQITKKASHPNPLIFDIQLERAKQKYVVQGRLAASEYGALELSAPSDQGEKADGDVKDGVTAKGEEFGVMEDKKGADSEVAPTTDKKDVVDPGNRDQKS